MREEGGKQPCPFSRPRAQGTGLGWVFLLLRETLWRRKRQLRRGQGLGLKLVEMHQFSGEAFNLTSLFSAHGNHLGMLSTAPPAKPQETSPWRWVEEGRVQDRASPSQREPPLPKVVPAGPETPAPGQPCPVSVRLFTGTQSWTQKVNLQRAARSGLQEGGTGSCHCPCSYRGRDASSSCSESGELCQHHLT